MSNDTTTSGVAPPSPSPSPPAMTERLSVSALSEGTAILVMGDAGVGKTTLIRGLNTDTTLLIGIDPGYDVIAGWDGHKAKLDESRIKSVTEYVQWLTINARGRYRTVVVDNVSYLEKWAIRSLTEFRGKEFTELKEYGDVGNVMRAWLTSMRDLRRHGVNVVFFSHIKTDMKGFEGVVHPSLQDKVSRDFLGYVDCVGYMSIAPDQNRTRTIQWDGSATVKAKRRYDCLQPIETVAREDEKYLSNVLARIHAEKRRLWAPKPAAAPQPSAPAVGTEAKSDKKIETSQAAAPAALK